MIGLQLEDAFAHGEQCIAILLVLELTRGRLVFGEGLGGHLLLAKQLGDLETARGVGRIEGGHLPQQLERIGLAAFAVIAVGRRLERTDRLRVEAHALIELGERDIRCVVFRIEIQDLLVDGDGARVEAVLAILLGDLAVLGDRVFRLAPAAIDVSHFEQELRIARVGLEQELVLLQRLGLRPLLREFACRIEHFSFIERQ